MARRKCGELRSFTGIFQHMLVGLSLGLWCVLIVGSPVEDFDVREHLSSTTRYDISRRVADKIDHFLSDATPPEGCVPIHLNLVARHGTRSPTKKRIRQLEKLAVRLKALTSSLFESPQSVFSSRNVPNWLREWHSPFGEKFIGGELTVQGEMEMYSLAERLKHQFPEIFKENYHPDIYPIAATQVPRASASAVAFGMGLFAGNGSLGPGQHRAFAVITDSQANDIHLRFHDCCQNYKESKATRKPAVERWQENVYVKVSTSLRQRYGINFTSADISSVWFLCKQEASILDIIDQACGLFTAEEVELLEWADDVELHQLKGYGEAINYRMGIPLLHNVLHAMEHAIQGSEGAGNSNFLEKARLRFAHAETVVPFVCLLGLFLEGADVKTTVQEEKPVPPPPSPPFPRLWRGSVLAPFGVNTMLVLYKCSSKEEGAEMNTHHVSKGSFTYLVQALHNEKPVPMSACNGTPFCPFEIFRDAVAAPHLKHSFEGLCSIRSIPPQSWLQWALGYARGMFYRSPALVKETHGHNHLEL